MARYTLIFDDANGCDVAKIYESLLLTNFSDRFYFNFELSYRDNIAWQINDVLWNCKVFEKIETTKSDLLIIYLDSWSFELELQKGTQMNQPHSQQVIAADFDLKARFWLF